MGNLQEYPPLVRFRVETGYSVVRFIAASLKAGRMMTEACLKRVYGLRRRAP